MNESITLIGLLLTPLLTAFACFIFPQRTRLFTLICLIITPVFLINLIKILIEIGPVRHSVGGWGTPLGIDLSVDGLSAIMLLVTLIISGAVLIYAKNYYEHEKNVSYFWPLALILWSALNALFMSNDIFNIYVSLELIGIIAVALAALNGTLKALKAALRYLFVGLIASSCYLLGVALLYKEYGALDITLLSNQLISNPITYVAFALMTLGLLTKSALFPMHFWLPPAHSNASAPVSALLSAIVVKASFYILLRLWFQLFPEIIIPSIANLLGILGSIAVLWGSIQALRQERIKLMIAYSTVAQLGYLFLVFPLAVAGQSTAAIGGALYLIMAHACAKAAMFLGAGAVLHSAGHDRINELQGLAKHMPVTVFTFTLAGISLMGLPPSGGFVAKWSLLLAAVESGQWGWAIILLLGSLLAAAYIFRLISPALLQRGVGQDIEDEKQWQLMIWPAFILSLLSVILGFASNWLFNLFAIGFDSIMVIKL